MVTIIDGVEVYPYRPPVHQTPTTTDDIAVQNTWYTAFDKTNCEMLNCRFNLTVANETVEVRVTLDGVVYTGAQAVVAAENRYPVLQVIDGSCNLATTAAFAYNVNPRMQHFRGRTVKIEFRKTTNTGASHLITRCIWEKYMP